MLTNEIKEKNYSLKKRKELEEKLEKFWRSC
jgi:hypothetical protein